MSQGRHQGFGFKTKIPEAALQTGDVELEGLGHLASWEDLVKEAIQLHYGNRRNPVF